MPAEQSLSLCLHADGKSGGASSSTEHSRASQQDMKSLHQTFRRHRGEQVWDVLGSRLQRVLRKPCVSVVSLLKHTGWFHSWYDDIRQTGASSGPYYGFTNQ